MLIPKDTDALTLAYIHKSMPADQLRKAEDAGMFDLLKSNLHPKKVLVHGKHGPYYATRMVSDDSGEKSVNTAMQTEDDEQKSIASVQADIKRYSGRSLKDVYAAEGEKGVVRALGAQYAERESCDEKDIEWNEKSYGRSNAYTPLAAARAMQIWTAEKLRVPETEGMDEDELGWWYDDNYNSDMHVNPDGMMWACSLIREMQDAKVDENSESEITASVCGHVLDALIQEKGSVYDAPLYRGVVMPEGTIDDILDRGKVDLEGISSFSRSCDVAKGFVQDSPAWDAMEDSLPDAVIFVIPEEAGVTSYRILDSKYPREAEHLVGTHPPFEVSKVLVDDPEFGLNMFEDYDEDDFDPDSDHMYYVYLKEGSNE